MFAIIATLVMTHITIVCVTVYLHRGQAHRALTFSPVLEHFMRFWLWLTTGMITKEWVAVHRKHHQACEKIDDPHSPWVYGIWRVLFGGAWLYVAAKKNTDMVRQYGVGTPDDWIERNVYSRFPTLGIWSMLLIDILFFGAWGFVVWGVQMIWIPFWAAGVVNGIGHWWGYRNTNTKDRSRNIVPLGLVIGGEELHNNHHNNPASAKLSEKWWEFDAGWFWINVFRTFGLIKIRA